MRDLLVPIFGEWGAVVAQFLLTVIIVFGLIGAVWWFMRRYSGVHFGGIGRGRVPRLAVVDVLTVDRRRKLVLVRRDNVEHLLMIGGPSDVVVEGTIQRVRQRSAQAAAQAAAARAALQAANGPPPPAEPEGPPAEIAAVRQRPANEPIPFPLARSAHQQAPSGNGRAAARPERRPPPAPPPEVVAAPEPAPEAVAEPEPEPEPAPAASVAEPQRPAPRQAQPGPEAAAPPPPQEPPPQEPPPPPPPQAQRETAEPAARTLLPEIVLAETASPPPSPPAPAAAPAPATFAEAELEAAEEARQSALDLGDGEAPATAAEPAGPAFAAPEQPQAAPAESATRVSDLEREMARLLDEITTRRSS